MVAQGIWEKLWRLGLVVESTKKGEREGREEDRRGRTLSSSDLIVVALSLLEFRNCLPL